MSAYLCIFGQLYLALGGNPKSHFLAQKCVGNEAIIRVCRVVDRLSSISGARIMAQKPHFSNKSKNCRKSVSCPLTTNWPAIPRQKIMLESYSNPLKTHETLYFGMKKQLLRFGFGIFGGYRQGWGMFCPFFGFTFMTSSPKNEPIL